ncbi:hypothetical protein ACFVP0_04635 [Streptomyces cinereoruber]|uniref:hypothetical protein n=1 Tax=Streptomyces cinereoruber TaxID=67260 RepID=UPI0036875127
MPPETVANGAAVRSAPDADLKSCILPVEVRAGATKEIVRLPGEVAVRPTKWRPDAGSSHRKEPFGSLTPAYRLGSTTWRPPGRARAMRRPFGISAPVPSTLYCQIRYELPAPDCGIGPVPTELTTSAMVKIPSEWHSLCRRPSCTTYVCRSRAAEIA